MHPVDEKYASLGAKLELVQPKSEEFEMISTYCSQTMRGNSVQLQVRAGSLLDALRSPVRAQKSCQHGKRRPTAR